MKEREGRVQTMHFLVCMGDGHIGHIDYDVFVEPLHDNGLTSAYIHYVITHVTRVPIEWYIIEFS